MSTKCRTCERFLGLSSDRLCHDCLQVETHLANYLASPKGQDFVRNLFPKIDNWPEWDYEAVLRENEVEVVWHRDYWYSMGWRHGSMGINADDETIARKSAAIFVSLWLRGFSCSFADNISHGFAMWLELQNQRYSFELTKELGDAIIELEDHNCIYGDGLEAWNKLVDSARLLRGREQ